MFVSPSLSDREVWKSLNSWISYFLCCQQKLLVNLIKLVLHTARVHIDCLNKNARKHQFSYSSLTRSNLKSFTECRSQVCKDVSMLLWCCKNVTFSSVHSKAPSRPVNPPTFSQNSSHSPPEKSLTQNRNRQLTTKHHDHPGFYEVTFYRMILLICRTKIDCVKSWKERTGEFYTFTLLISSHLPAALVTTQLHVCIVNMGTLLTCLFKLC